MDITRGEASPGPGFERASSIYSSLNPTTTNLYTPHITDRPSICSSTITVYHSAESEATQKAYEFQVATNLPPTLDTRTCRCMMDSIECVANHTYQTPLESSYASIFTQKVFFEDEKQLLSLVCSKNDSLCLGSQSDTVNGRFGAFSACNSTERGSWILNGLYKSSNRNTTTCRSTGGILRETGPLPSACMNVMKQAGPLGAGSVILSLAFGDRNTAGLGSIRSLSQGAKAGIGVGITVFLVFLSGAIFLGLRLRKKRRKKDDLSQDDKHSFGKAELPATTMDAPEVSRAEVHGECVNEMDGSMKFLELSADKEIIELPDLETKSMEFEEIFELPNNEQLPTELDPNPNKPIVYERNTG
jgi:X8 domain-containing protein